MKTYKWYVVWHVFTILIMICVFSNIVLAQSNQQDRGFYKSSFMLLSSFLADKKADKKTDKPAKTPEPNIKKKETSLNNTLPISSTNKFPSIFVGAEEPPLGFAGPKSSVKINKPKTDEQESGDFIPVDDRWRVGFPEWDRHGDPTKANYPYTKGSILNPYRQNVLKGDYPILGSDKFFTLALTSETFLSTRRIPIPNTTSVAQANGKSFERGGLFLFNQNFSITGDFFQGAASFKPVDWRVHATVVFNLNYAHAGENANLGIASSPSHIRRDSIIALQEAYGEYRLGDTTKIFPFLRGKGSKGGYSPFYDTTSIRGGIQLLNSDFRGFVFNDTNLGVRLFGNFASNRYQYNVAYFDLFRKDINSGLNTLSSRGQRVFIANLYRQDTIKKGYTVELSYHYNQDDGQTQAVEKNSFPQGSKAIGVAVPHKLRTHYFGFTTDGHFGERLPKILGLNKIGGGLNLSTAFYQVLGTDDFNGLAGRKVDVNAQLVAIELSVNRDWKRFRTSFLYSSGDSNPTDGTARGFDHIAANNNFAGGTFSFFNQVGLPFLNATQTTSQSNLIPNLRSSKAGQANYINPGLFLYNTGTDLDITQKIRVISNVNFLRFATTEPLVLGLSREKIEKNLGIDFSTAIKYRPILTENIVIFSGFSALRPGAGFTSIYESNCKPAGLPECGKDNSSKTLFNIFATVKITY